MLIRLRELTSASCQSMTHISKSVHPRVTSCVTLLGTLLEHLIIFKPFDASNSDDRYGSKVFSQYHPHPHQWPEDQGLGLGSL